MKFSKHSVQAVLAIAGLAALVPAAHAQAVVGTDLHSTVGGDAQINALLSANRGSNGGGDQSLQFGDIIYGSGDNDILVGALGVDVLVGGAGDDIIIGGTEDFNPLNRDRGFGNAGSDVFIWAPGDGNDFFDGGAGTDVLMLGLVGEQRDADGNKEGAPFFAVSPPGTAGSQDFDGVYINSAVTGLPVVDVANGPGFCEVVDGYDEYGDAIPEVLDELRALNLDHLVRFTLRGPANALAAALEADPYLDTDTQDTGLRIAMHVKNTEFLVCGSRDGGSIVTLDLTTTPPTPVETSVLPANAFNSLQSDY